jgi:hypothetical protein
VALIEFKRNPTVRDLRQFGGIWLPLFLLLVAGTFYRAGGVRGAAVLLGLAALSALVGWTAPRLIRPIVVGWMVLAYPIGWLVSHLTLAIVFYLVMAPVGLLLRAIGYDLGTGPLNRGSTSGWRRLPARDDVESAFRQF